MIYNINKIETIFLFDFIQSAATCSLLHSSNCHQSSTYMTSVVKGGAGGPAKGLAPAHFFPLEGTASLHILKRVPVLQVRKTLKGYNNHKLCLCLR